MYKYADIVQSLLGVNLYCITLVLKHLKSIRSRGTTFRDSETPHVEKIFLVISIRDYLESGPELYS